MGEEITITTMEKDNRLFFVIFPFGNISQPILILEDWQLEKLLKKVGLKAVPIE